MTQRKIDFIQEFELPNQGKIETSWGEVKDNQNQAPSIKEKNDSGVKKYASLSEGIPFLSHHPLTEKIIAALKEIYDPEIPVNIYDLGLIYSVEIDVDNTVMIDMTLTSPMCPVAQTFPQTVQDHVLLVEGVSAAAVHLVWDPPWSKDNMSEAVKLQLNLF